MSELTLHTQRLTLRKPTVTDASQLLQLFNQPDFIENIRDKHIRTEQQAIAEIEQVLLPHYDKYGFCLLSMDTAEEACIGMCGLVKRPALNIPDIGFAILSEHQNKGYVTEASVAVLEHGFNVLNLETIAAIVNPDNMASISVITKLDMSFIRGMQLDDDDAQVKYFELTRSAFNKAHA